MENLTLSKCPVCNKYRHKEDINVKVNIVTEDHIRIDTLMCSFCDIKLNHKPEIKNNLKRLDEVIRD